MAFGQVIVVVCLLGLTLGKPSSEENARTTRTFGSFFGGGSTKQQQQQQPDPAPVVNNYGYSPYDRPLVYQVKYYDTPAKDVGRNTIDKAGEVRQEIGQQRVFFYTTNGVVGEQVQQQQFREPTVVQVPQGYVYVNPVVGGGQPQTYIVGQVGNQQVLVPCPVDYAYQSQGQVVQPVEKVVPVPVKPAVVQPVVSEVKGREQQQYVYSQQTPTGQQGNRRPVNNVPEVVYNPYGGGYYSPYGYGSYPSYVNPYVTNPYGVSGVGYNYNSYYNPYGSDSQVVTVVPPGVTQVTGVTPQGSTTTTTSGAGSNANSPYVYVYRGGVQGYQPVFSPYVIPVQGVVRPKEQVQGQVGSASTRVNVSSQGQQPATQQQQQAQQTQQAEAKKTTGTD